MVFYNYKFRGRISNQLSNQWSSSYEEVYAIVKSGRIDIVQDEIVSRNFDETIEHSTVSEFAYWKCVDVRDHCYLLCLNPAYMFGSNSTLAEVDGQSNGRAAFRIANIELAGLQKATVAFGRTERHYSETIKEAMRSVEQHMGEGIGRLYKIVSELYKGMGYA